MAKKSNYQKASELYMAGLSKKDIANILELSPQTLSRYSKKGDWKAKRAEREMRETSVFDDCLELLHYQVNAIKQRKNEWIEAGETTKLIDKGEIDALQKLYTTIRRDLTQYEHRIKTMTEFVSFLKSRDLSLTKKILDYQGEFLKEMQKNLGF